MDLGLIVVGAIVVLFLWFVLDEVIERGLDGAWFGLLDHFRRRPLGFRWFVELIGLAGILAAAVLLAWNLYLWQPYF